MKTRICEICGKPTPESAFSKSYKNRCKECVARQTRDNRAAARTTADSHAEFISAPNSQPNWEERRYELVRDFYLKWTNIDDIKNEVVMATRIEKSERAADILINKMKGE